MVILGYTVSHTMYKIISIVCTSYCEVYTHTKWPQRAYHNLQCCLVCKNNYIVMVTSNTIPVVL